MRIAVTGSSGFVGRALCASLTDNGHDVVRMVRPGSPSLDGAVGWDPAAGTIDRAGLVGVDAVVHLAGEGIGDHRWTAAHKRRVLESRVAGTRLIATTLASLDGGPRRLLSGSAIGIYGNRGDEILSETSALGGGFLAEVCIAWEAATAPAEAAGLDVVHLRTGIVLDPAGGALARLVPLFRAGLGGRFGSGRQWMSWITLADEVAAIRFLLEHPMAGAVDLTAPTPVTNRELTATLARVLHRPAFVPVPAFGPALLYGRELVDEMLLGSQRVLPARLAEAGFAFGAPELDGALRGMLGR